jgi:hypothetical protein
MFMESTARYMALRSAMVVGIALLLGLTGPIVSAQNDAAPAKPAPAVLRFKLLDGSVVSGTMAIEALEVKTSYGTLTVPIKAIRSFTPGLDSRPQVGEMIDKLILQLGDMDAAKRDAAQNELMSMGARIKRQLEQRANDEDPERRLRIGKILEELAEMADDSLLGTDDSAAVMLRKLDIVETDEFTIAGSVNPKQFQIASQYGMLTVKLSDIDNAEVNNPDKARDIREKVTVAGTNLSSISYKSTGIAVRRGDVITIKATGQVALQNWGQVATPDGNPNTGWYIPNDIPFAMLIGKIGDDGPEFKVGSSLQMTAKKNGVLQLAVAMPANYARQAFPGQYEARVHVQGK